MRQDENKKSQIKACLVKNKYNKNKRRTIYNKYSTRYNFFDQY